jgi:hypothetical protein
MGAMRVRQAIVSALADEMRSDDSVIFFGEDIAAAEGPFKTSEGILDEFGPVRVRDTPISEMAFTGAAVGAAMMGLKPVVEIMFIEFLGVALDALVTEGAKMHYLSNGELSVPMTIRASVGNTTATISWDLPTSGPALTDYVLQYRKGLSGFAHNPHTLIADFLQSDVTAVYFLALHAGRVAIDWRVASITRSATQSIRIRQSTAPLYPLDWLKKVPKFQLHQDENLAGSWHRKHSFVKHVKSLLRKRRGYKP